MAAVLIDPETASSRVVIGAIERAPIVIDDAAALFGGKLTSDLDSRFDPRAADALLLQAGVTDAASRHIHVAVLTRAVRDAAR